MSAASRSSAALDRPNGGLYKSPILSFGGKGQILCFIHQQNPAQSAFPPPLLPKRPVPHLLYKAESRLAAAVRHAEC